VLSRVYAQFYDIMLEKNGIKNRIISCALFCLLVVLQAPSGGCFAQGKTSTGGAFSIPREWQEMQEISGETGASYPEGSKVKGRYGWNLNIAMPLLRTLDSQRAVRSDVKSIIRCVQEGLYAYDKNNVIVPILAARMPERTSENTYLIALQRGVSFHNGDYFEAKDVAFTLNRLLRLKNNFPARERFSSIISVKEVDNYSVSVVVKDGYPSLANLLTNTETFPLSRKAVLEYGNDAYGKFTLIGTGPFWAYEYTKDTSLTLLRNFQYRYDWLPYCGSINIDFFKTPKKSLKRILQRRLSMVLGIPRQTVLSYVHKYNVVKAYKGEGGLLEQVYLNTSVEPFNNINVRKAFSYAIDREAVVKHVFWGAAEAAAGIFPTWMAFHDPKIDIIRYNHGKAEEYLKLAGYSVRSPLRLTMFVGETENFKKLGEVLKTQLAKVGINLDILLTSKNDLLSYVYGINGKEREFFKAALEDWQGDESPLRYTRPLYYSKSPYNKVHYNSALFDKKMDIVINKTHLGEKVPLYRSMEWEVGDDYNTVPICFVQPVVLGVKHIKGLRVYMDGSLDFRNVWMDAD